MGGNKLMSFTPDANQQASQQAWNQQQNANQVQNLSGGVTPQVANQSLPGQQATLGSLDINKTQRILDPTVQSTVADAAIKQRQADAQQFLDDAGNQLNNARDKKTGYVSPGIYNDLQDQAVQKGASMADFYGRYGGLTDPHSPLYATDTSRQVKAGMDTTLQQLSGILKSYNDIPQQQKGFFQPGALASLIPGLGAGIAPRASEYETNVKPGMAAILAPYVGGGTGSNLRITQPELNTWKGLLPSIHKTNTANQYDVHMLDANIYAKFGQHLDPGVLSMYGLDKTGNYANNSGDKSSAPQQGGQSKVGNFIVEPMQ